MDSISPSLMVPSIVQPGKVNSICAGSEPSGLSIITDCNSRTAYFMPAGMSVRVLLSPPLMVTVSVFHTLSSPSVKVTSKVNSCASAALVAPVISLLIFSAPGLVVFLNTGGAFCTLPSGSLYSIEAVIVPVPSSDTVTTAVYTLRSYSTVGSPTSGIFS